MKTSNHLLSGAVFLCWAAASVAAPPPGDSAEPHSRVESSPHGEGSFEFVLRGSHRLRDKCHQRIELKVDTIRTDPSSIRLSGRVAGQFWLCAKVSGSWLKTRIGQQSADLDAIIALQREANCLRLRITRLSLRPRAPYGELFLGVDLKPELMAVIANGMVGHDFC